MSNGEYRQYIIDMLYQMDRIEDNQFLKSVYTTVHYQFIRKDAENLKSSDKYLSKVLRIINGLEPESIKKIYFLLEGITGISL